MSTTGVVTRHEVFQTSLMSALLDGVYEDEMTIGELLGHGGFGIGTFNALDGELLVLGGVAYQLRGDGTVTRAGLDERTPYSVVTNFVPHIHAEFPADVTRTQASVFIDTLLPSQNYMYALRITGEFSSVRTRTVVKQEKPYRPMVEATDDDEIREVDDVRGTIVGFRTPLYEQGISVPGCHVHFIDDDRTRGGHVLDFELRHGEVELCLGTDLQLRLPLTSDFQSADLSPEDLQRQLDKTESHA